MKGKSTVVPILVIALVTFFTVPPAQSDFLVLSAILEGAFISTELIVENNRSNDEQTTAQQDEQEKTIYASSDAGLSTLP